MSPGLLVAASFGSRKTLAVWLLSGFAISVVLLVSATTAFQLVTGIIPKSREFFFLVLVVLAVCMLTSVIRLRAGDASRVELAGQGADLAVAVLIGWLFLILLSPKFYWENFTGDGLDTLLSARIHIYTLWPFWPKEAGVVAGATALTTMLYGIPASWFVRLLGESEFAVRAPYLLYLSLLYPVVIALIRTGRQARIGASTHLLIAAMLFVYTISVIFSGGYSPYSKDVAHLAGRETLALVTFLGYILFFVEGRKPLMVVFGIFAYLSIPTGGFWILLWSAAVVLTWRPVPWDRLVHSGFILAICLGIALLGPALIRVLGLPGPSVEFGAGHIVDRLRFVSFADFDRFLFLAVPCGILPVFFLLTWRRQDSVSRALSVVTIVYFFFFYFQAYRVLLHHFIPAMIPPVIVFWRSKLLEDARLSVPIRAAAAAGVVAALWLAWPKEMRIHTYDRTIGRYIAALGPRFQGATPGEGDRFPGYEPKALNTAHELLQKLFPPGYRDQDPKERFYGTPLVWYYYSLFPKPNGQVVNYVIRPLVGSQDEAGSELFASYDGYGLFVRDRRLLAKQQTTVLPTDTGSQLLTTRRDIIFGKGESWDDRIVIDLLRIARRVCGRVKGALTGYLAGPGTSIH